eukprot:SAG11_NODE_3193_length_2622_cov_1.318668_2_plen_45_part_00
MVGLLVPTHDLINIYLIHILLIDSRILIVFVSHLLFLWCTISSM